MCGRRLRVLQFSADETAGTREILALYRGNNKECSCSPRPPLHRPNRLILPCDVGVLAGEPPRSHISIEIGALVISAAHADFPLQQGGTRSKVNESRCFACQWVGQGEATTHQWGDDNLRSYDAPTEHKGAEISRRIFAGWMSTDPTPEPYANTTQQAAVLFLMFWKCATVKRCLASERVVAKAWSSRQAGDSGCKCEEEKLLQANVH